MINPWKQGRIPGVPIHPPLGAWQSRRTLASAAFVPPQWVRESLKGAHPFWYQFPQLTLAAAETDLHRSFHQRRFLGDVRNVEHHAGDSRRQRARAFL